MKFVPTYRPRPSALHSARAGVAAFFCGSLAFAGAIDQHPLVLAAPRSPASGWPPPGPAWVARCWTQPAWRCPSPCS